jgi:hypothetical protein
LKLDGHDCSPAILKKIVTAGAHHPSFAGAARLLADLAEVALSGRQVDRITAEIGGELLRRRDQQTQAFADKSLKPQVPTAPALAVVEVDGGRLQIRAPDSGPGVHDPAWKEDKVAGLVTMHRTTHADDPHPDLPACFRDQAQMAALVRGVSRQGALEPVAEAPEATAPSEPAATAATAEERAAAWQPKALVRTCVATTACSDAFGPMVAAEARARNFPAAAAQAFVGDGQEWNWTLQRRYFPKAVAIADLIHVLTYVYLAAKAVLTTAAGRWSQYLDWAEACWQGRVAEVIAELRTWQEQLGPLPADEEVPESDPRRVVARTLVYLEHNRPRMDYPRYRREGLPVTSSLIESLIKQVNYRVKGTEKFWNPRGAETILQVRAAVLSEDQRLSKHLANRSCSAFRPYQSDHRACKPRKPRRAG